HSRAIISIHPFDMLSPMRALLLLVLIASAFAQEPSSEQLDFLHGLDEYENVRDMLPDYMRDRGDALVQARKRSLSLTTADAGHACAPRLCRTHVGHARAG